MSKILLADSDPSSSKRTLEWILSERHVIELAIDQEEACRLATLNQYDLVLLESQPGMDAVRICSQMRQAQQEALVIIISDAAGIQSKQAAFHAGTDDYLSRPFQYEELMWRIQALLRRPRTWQADSLTGGGLELDRNRLVVTAGGTAIRLTQLEFNLLEFLMRNQGTVFSPGQLIGRVWAGSELPSVYALRHCLGKIRAKIEATGTPSPITNIRGAGYKFEVAGVDQARAPLRPMSTKVASGPFELRMS